MKTKIFLKRLKLDSTKSSINAPDYESFFTSKGVDFHAVGWLDTFCDLSITIEKIDLSKDVFKNKFFLKKYAEFIKSKPA